VSAAALLAERALELAALPDARSLSDAELLDAVGRVGELTRLAEGLGAMLAGEVDHRSAPEQESSLSRSHGEKSGAVLVALHAGLDVTEAVDWCRVGAAMMPPTTLLGEVLPLTRPVVAEAVAEGRVRVAAASRILATLEVISATAPPPDLPVVEAFLVEQAPQLSPRQLARLCRALPDRYDPDGAEPREDLLREKSGVQVVHTREGLVRWIVTMHPEAAGFLTAAVDARTAPRRQPTFHAVDEHLDGLGETGGLSEPDGLGEPGGDTRPLGQRRLDALVSMARESLQHDPGLIAGTAVTMMVTIPLDSLVTGIGAAEIAGVDEPISAATARRLAAEAEIIPIVLGSPSEPLDQGRAVRLFTEAQRRAIAVRDGGCVWPGCNAPPGWCEVAHIVAWILGGLTDIKNGVLLCPFHHRRFDHDEWAMQWREGGLYLIPPPWVDPTRTPRRAGRLTQVA
jgi:5-methylcytosine-specific restriction protein A